MYVLNLFNVLYKLNQQMIDQEDGLSKWIIGFDLLTHQSQPFFLCLSMTGIIHVREHILFMLIKIISEKVLKKLRKIGSKNQASLHKKKLQFKYSEKNQISKLNGEGLTMAIKKYVANSPVRYAEDKLQIVRSIGYENKNKLCKFNILLPDKKTNVEEYLINFLIGLIPDLKVFEWEEKDIRLGIVAENSIKHFESGRLEIDHNPGKGKIVLNSNKNDKQVTIDADVYLPNGIDIRQKKNFKIRFSTTFYDFVLQPYFLENGKNGNICFHFPSVNEKWDLNILKQMADIVSFFDRTGGNIEFKYEEISFSTTKLEIQSNVFFDEIYIKLARSIEKALGDF